MVQATASVEEFLQDKGDEVSHGLIIVMNFKCMFIIAACQLFRNIRYSPVHPGQSGTACPLSCTIYLECLETLGHLLEKN